MGILYGDVRNLIERFRPESEGKRVVTFGRLSIYLHPPEIFRLKRLLSDDRDALSYLKSYQWGEYSERFFKALFKCSVVDSLDFSDYQGATILHDLQQPIPGELRGKYDLVLDGGTMEHVFNLPAALANAIRLVRVGGLVYINSPCNNLSGHGFYQFSPELMYRVMSRDNGMAMLLTRIGVACVPSVEKTFFHRVYDVVDPDSVQRRVGLQTSRPVYMMVMARKTEDAELFSRPVLQSDYRRKWTSGARKGLVRRVLDGLPFQLQSLVLGCLGYLEVNQHSLANTRFYHRVW